MPCLVRTVALGCCLVLAAPCFGWWELGHRTVARLAVQHLTPAARVRVSRILGVADTPQAIADALADASTWADATKVETHTSEWHYIDLALQDSRANMGARCPGGNCVTVKIVEFARQLKSQPEGGRWSELDALRYVVHFIGDVHQPLHAVSDADLGGNCEPLDPPVDTAKNLHALWDGAFPKELDAGDVELATNLEGYLRQLGEAKQAEWSKGSADDWAWESHELATEDVYGKFQIPLEPVIFPHGCGEAPAAIVNFKIHADALYISNMKPVVRDQLAKAALRLAKTLNEAM